MLKLLIAFLLFILSTTLIGQNLDKPFWGVHDWNGVRYGNIARNYLKYSLIGTKLGQVENSGFVDRSQFEYLTHYPPLLPLTISISYKLFGISEWSTRFPSLLATSASMVLIFLIGSHLWDIKRGLIASLLVLFTPAVLYFGKIPSHEPLVIFFILLAYFGYLKYQTNKEKKFQAVFLLGLILAQLTTWVGYFLIPALTISSAFKRDFKEIKKLIPYWILSLIFFCLHLIYVFILTGSIFGGKLFESLLQRIGIYTDVQPEHFNLVNYLWKVRLWFSTLFTNTLTLLIAIWLFSNRKGLKDTDWSILTLGFTALIYIILFSNAVFIHNYLIFYFLPFMALAGIAGLFYLTKIKFSYPFKLILLIIFLVTIFFERKSYLEALNKSDVDKFAVEVGQAINRQTSPEDTILISPLKFVYSAEKFLKFYSDRKLIFADIPQLDYDYMVTVDTDQNTFQITKK